MSYSTQRAVSLDGMLALLDIEIEYFGREEISVYFDSVQYDADPRRCYTSTRLSNLDK